MSKRQVEVSTAISKAEREQNGCFLGIEDPLYGYHKLNKYFIYLGEKLFNILLIVVVERLQWSLSDKIPPELQPYKEVISWQTAVQLHIQQNISVNQTKIV